MHRLVRLPAPEQSIVRAALSGMPEVDRAFDQAISLDREFAYAFYNRWVVHTRTGQYDQALADLSRAIEIDGRNTLGYYVRGFFYAETGKLVEAAPDLEKAIELGLDAGAKQVAEDTLVGLGQ